MEMAAQSMNLFHGHDIVLKYICRLRCPKIPFEASVLHPIQCTAKHCIMGFLAIQQKFDSFLALSILNVKI